MLTIENKKKTKFLITAILLLVVVFLFNINIGWAETGSFGDMRISNYLKQVAISPDVNLSGDRPEITTVIGTILYGVLGFLGVLCLLLTIYAGLKWMLAEGNEETISESRKIIFYSIIGLAIIMGAYAMTSFVIDKVWEGLIPESTINTPNPQSVDFNFKTPMPDYDNGGGCLDSTECDCTYGSPYCNRDSGTGICECHNSCSTCDTDCRDAGHDGGHCDSTGYCNCY